MSSKSSNSLYNRLPTIVVSDYTNNRRSQTPPPPATSASRRPPSRRFLRRLLTATALTLAVLLTFRVYIHELTGVPTYDEIKEYERRLPQHNLDLAFPEGRNGRYVKFVPYAGYGWNNELQDIIMVSQIALLADRGYVFQPYIWSQNPITPVVMQRDLGFRSARIPLNAFISGPIAGNGPWAHTNANGNANANVNGSSTLLDVPRSISYEWWETVCPPERRVQVDVQTTRKELGIEWGAPVRTIIERWAEKLRTMDETCVEVTGDRVFTFFDYGETRLLSAWPLLSSSPTLAQLTWSPLVQNILHRNIALGLLQPPTTHETSTSTHDVTHPLLSNVLAIHIRRGDFQRHCLDRYTYGSTYNGWNSFPDYPDVFDPPPPSSPAERAESYKGHCFPSLEQIVARVNLVRGEWRAQTGRVLERVYVMTNADEGFLRELKERLMTAGDGEEAWKAVVTTNDLSVPAYSRELVVGADMLIGERAEVFIGNGFSSLSSNINLIRRSKGHSPTSSRFWHSDKQSPSSSTSPS